jgi:adenylate cyclase
LPPQRTEAAAGTVPGDVDWEEQGLLDDCPDDRAKQARRDLLDELHEDGVELEQLKEAVKGQRLALLPVERIVGGELKYSAKEVAEKTGFELETIMSTRRALGLGVPDPDEKAFGDDDVEAIGRQRKVYEAGFEREHLLETNRVLGRGLARYVEALRITISDALVEPDTDERELGRRFATAAAELVPLNTPWMEYVFSLHLRQMLRSEAVTLQERTAGRGEAREAAVAFADLVGFTELGQTVDVEELSGVASRLSRMAGDVVEPPVQLVKEIGDAVMLVAPEPKELLDATLALVERAEETEDFPKLRAGIAFGPAANHFGDWYGSTVNLASRLTGRARPGSVLVTDAVREAVDGDGYSISSAGQKRFKGISEPVKTFRVRREQGE